MSDQYETLMHRWFEEVWNKGREDAIDEMLASDGIVHGLADQSGNELRGPEGFKPFFHSFRSAFPDIQVTVEDGVQQDEKIAVRCTVRGTHTGEGLGLAATNNPMEFTGMCMVRVKDGKITEAWNNFDFTTMFQQMGVLNPQDSTGAKQS